MPDTFMPESSGPIKPTPADLQSAVDKTVPDLVAPNLMMLFVGINPGLYSGATGHHFARPGNRFWPALFRSGITPRLLHPWEERELLTYGCGVTCMVARTTASAQELAPEEYREGAARLEGLVRALTPRLVCVLGLGAYRTGFGRPTAQEGPQDERIAGVPVYLLPNPSGLNAHSSVDSIAKGMAAARAEAQRSQ